MFLGAFQNDLKDKHLNDSLAQKPAADMNEVMNKQECCINGEERNMEKRSQDAKNNIQSRHDEPPAIRDHHMHESRNDRQ